MLIREYLEKLHEFGFDADEKRIVVKNDKQYNEFEKYEVYASVEELIEINSVYFENQVEKFSREVEAIKGRFEYKL